MENLQQTPDEIGYQIAMGNILAGYETSQDWAVVMSVSEPGHLLPVSREQSDDTAKFERIEMGVK